MDFVGQRFGRLTVVEEFRLSGLKHVRCVCDCGTVRVAVAYNVKRGRTASCGCLRREAMRAKKTTHAMSASPEYRTWTKIKLRCHDHSSPDFPDYGARGIAVCERWRQSFENFLADMGKRPPGTSIERINNSGNYEPGNCRWATAKEQARNRRSSRTATIDGETLTIAEWCERLGLSKSSVSNRIYRQGMSPEDAIADAGGK